MDCFCLETEVNNSMVIQCCNKKLHKQCLKRWFETKLSCPMCRHEFQRTDLPVDLLPNVTTNTNTNRSNYDWTGIDLENFAMEFQRLENDEDRRNLVTNFQNRHRIDDEGRTIVRPVNLFRTE
jgi:hypothetical protein